MLEKREESISPTKKRGKRKSENLRRNCSNGQHYLHDNAIKVGGKGGGGGKRKVFLLISNEKGNPW